MEKMFSLALALFFSFMAVPPSRAADSSKLVIAHGAISNNVAPLWIAKEQGLFKKYGLDVDLVFIIAGRAMQAMLAGQVPVGVVGGTHVTNANTAGGDFRMILGLENRLDYIFVAQPAIKTAADLKGKKVAIGTPAGWLLWLAPLAMLLLVTKVTGIPPTEAQSLRSRGDDYRAYQRSTSPFFPWPPKRGATARTAP